MVSTTRRALVATGSLAAAVAAVPIVPARRVLAQGTGQMDAQTVMLSDPRFRTWVSIVEVSGLTPYARGGTPFTVFAPTEAAYDRYPTLRQERLPNAAASFPDTSGLMSLVRAHVLLGLHPVEEFRGRRTSVRNVAGMPMTVDGTDPAALVISWGTPAQGKGQARVSGASVSATNAVIYPINDVILA